MSCPVLFWLVNDRWNAFPLEKERRKEKELIPRIPIFSNETYQVRVPFHLEQLQTKVLIQGHCTHSSTTPRYLQTRMTCLKRSHCEYMPFPSQGTAGKNMALSIHSIVEGTHSWQNSPTSCAACLVTATISSSDFPSSANVPAIWKYLANHKKQLPFVLRQALLFWRLIGLMKLGEFASDCGKGTSHELLSRDKRTRISVFTLRRKMIPASPLLPAVLSAVTSAVSSAFRTVSTLIPSVLVRSAAMPKFSRSPV